jgi:hypothetical protein
VKHLGKALVPFAVAATLWGGISAFTGWQDSSHPSPMTFSLVQLFDADYPYPRPTDHCFDATGRGLGAPTFDVANRKNPTGFVQCDLSRKYNVKGRGSGRTARIKLSLDTAPSAARVTRVGGYFAADHNSDVASNANIEFDIVSGTTPICKAEATAGAGQDCVLASPTPAITDRQIEITMHWLGGSSPKEAVFGGVQNGSITVVATTPVTFIDRWADELWPF